jgi:cellulose biosynthesis protein BcsQ
MYIVTFYSFKGGVGRSMALANVASELANKGKRVLMVDFDLEAPGLHTFEFGAKLHPKGGVVDYVEEYLKHNKSPDVTNHIQEFSSDCKNNGKLWLMPAGKLDNTYSVRLSKLDWNDLYENRSGYLFFEDLKQQWKEKYNPDYILIDSRTGHTDVGGICTRQLPNSVVFLFFPNEQNLAGLKKVVNSVDEQNRSVSDDVLKIDTHFVSSNVPDLDDEDQILSNQLDEFSKELGYKKITANLYRYNSLSLIKQQIFTLHRPKTQLAKQYRNLTNEIILKNYADIDGASSYLKGILTSKIENNHNEIENRLKWIQEEHNKNPVILSLLSEIKERFGDFEDSLSLINRAIEFGNTEPITKLKQAKLSLVSNENDLAFQSIKDALNSDKLDYSNVRLAINLLNKIDKSSLPIVLKSVAYDNLDFFESVDIINKYFTSDKSHLNLAIETISNLVESINLDDSDVTFELDFAKENLILLLIANGDFEKALSSICNKRPTESSSIYILFNYSMAEWGATKVIPIDLLEFIINKIDDDDFKVHDSNFNQCISLCYGLIGNYDLALDMAKKNKENALDTSHTFSCWSYLNSSNSEFLRDIDEMIIGFESGNIKPRFITMSNKFANHSAN